MTHQNDKINAAVTNRTSIRQKLRNLKLRYQKPHSHNGKPQESTFVPSHNHKRKTTITWVNRLRSYIPVTDFSLVPLKDAAALIAGFWKSLTREKLVIFCGSIILLAGLIYPWYQLPPLAFSSFGINPLWINLPRLIVAPLILAFLFATFRGHKKSARLLLWGNLIIPLLFPYLVNTWLPDVNYLTTAYYQQGKQAAVFSENRLPEVQAKWKQHIILEPVSPVRSIANLSIADSRFFQLSSWDRILREGFGYKRSFLAFPSKGWELTIIGMAIALMGFYLRDGIEGLRADLTWVVPITTLLVGCIFVSIVGTNIANYHLDVLFAKGEYNRVVETSKRLQFWYPPFKADEAFLKRLGEAGFYGDYKMPALRHFIKGLAQYKAGNLWQAEIDFRAAWELQPDLIAARGYLASILINQGVDAFDEFHTTRLPPLYGKKPVPYKRTFLDTSQALENSPAPEGAIAADFFEQALAIFPDHIQALNYLMLARAINNQFGESAQAAQEIIKIEEYFRPPHISLLGQAYLHLTWNDYHNGDLETAWKRYRQTIEPKTWKQSVEKQPSTGEQP
ncbi:MAG: hypothetical protein F6K10_10395 [Moorea sp. SIO2B7]|nr:hypothetical protein [Moorena sp. SIO2B7]